MIDPDLPGEPAPWLHPHPSEQELHRYYGPVRRQAPQLVLNASGFGRWHAPSRDLWGLRPRSPYRRSPSHVPCKSRRPGSRRLHAGHHLARNAGTRQTHPEGLPRTLGFDAISLISTPQQRTPDPRFPGSNAFWNVFLSWSPPDALTARLFPGRSPRQSSANAAPRWFDAYPRRADAGGPTSLHLSHSTAF